MENHVLPVIGSDHKNILRFYNCVEYRNQGCKPPKAKWALPVCWPGRSAVAKHLASCKVTGWEAFEHQPETPLVFSSRSTLGSKEVIFLFRKLYLGFQENQDG